MKEEISLTFPLLGITLYGQYGITIPQNSGVQYQNGTGRGNKEMGRKWIKLLCLYPCRCEGVPYEEMTPVRLNIVGNAEYAFETTIDDVLEAKRNDRIMHLQRLWKFPEGFQKEKMVYVDAKYIASFYEDQ